MITIDSRWFDANYERFSVSNYRHINSIFAILIKLPVYIHFPSFMKLIQFQQPHNRKITKEHFTFSIQNDSPLVSAQQCNTHSSHRTRLSARRFAIAQVQTINLITVKKAAPRKNEKIKMIGSRAASVWLFLSRLRHLQNVEQNMRIKYHKMCIK